MNSLKILDINIAQLDILDVIQGYPSYIECKSILFWQSDSIAAVLWKKCDSVITIKKIVHEGFFPQIPKIVKDWLKKTPIDENSFPTLYHNTIHTESSEFFDNLLKNRGISL